MVQSCSVAQLLAGLASARAPRLIDVRRRPVFELADELIADAAWRDPAQVAEWSTTLDADRPVVVYCVHGHEVSQGCAASLRERGLDVAFLEGGIAAWKAAGGPMTAKGGSRT